MKDIDFLPEWYMSRRRQQVRYRAQYVILTGIFGVVVMCSFIAGRSVTHALAQLSDVQVARIGAESVSNEYSQIKKEIADIARKTGLLYQIDSKIDVSSVLGEISFLVDSDMVLSSVCLVAEKFAEKDDVKTTAARYAQEELLGQVRFRVTINGLASDASDVADLIVKLEKSPYFCLVYPSYSRSKRVPVPGSNTKQLNVSEFEIVCYLANYRQEGASVVKQMLNEK